MPLIWTHVLFFQFLILISLEVEIIKIVRCQSIKSSGLRTLVCSICSILAWSTMGTVIKQVRTKNHKIRLNQPGQRHPSLETCSIYWDGWVYKTVTLQCWRYFTLKVYTECLPAGARKIMLIWLCRWACYSQSPGSGPRSDESQELGVGRVSARRFAWRRNWFKSDRSYQLNHPRLFQFTWLSNGA